MKRLFIKLSSLIAIGSIQIAGFSKICFGETGTSPDQPTKGISDLNYSGVSTSETIWMIIKVIFFLILIIGLFFIIIKFLSQKNKFLFGRSMRSLGGVPLGPNKSIQVVEIGRSLYIVGVGENVQLLEKIEDEDEVSYISDMLNSSNAKTAASFETFTGWLSKLRKKQSIIEESDEEVTASFQQIFHNKMHHLSDRKKMVEDLLMDDKNKDRLNDKQ
ncbi:flagellar biosynthetic protein FliO [Paenibacillus sp. FSL H7-0331]|uniref:flagellar biosynthetic protein FliO n=1 Tax=Paenibacillus sp. FSL H7-0331 TaxID=1920421 RepID=UPI00096FEDAD|nr:flagellar biosynthetic protein FliO [Paenibacillus sp. FSL H7-0331]OMF14618.1 flagellar protein [Paenibacillus sp. FSL H7-0331]